MQKVPGSNPTKTIDFFVILREQVCSMVNIGEGNLYVTCIKGFVQLLKTILGRLPLAPRPSFSPPQSGHADSQPRKRGQRASNPRSC